MKYKVIVEGGFTGISREYHGELLLTPTETASILEAMNEDVAKNRQIRDGLDYVVELENDTKVYHRKFEENNIPLSIRKFIDKVKQNKRS